MKENKKAILEILKKKSKKDGKFESLVLNLALQKIDSDSFEFDGDAVYTADKKRLVYCMSQAESFHIPEGVTTIGEMAFRGKKQLKNIIIANSVKEIEHDAFYDCDELDNVYVPAGVKEVKSYAFAAKPFTSPTAIPTSSYLRNLPTMLPLPLLHHSRNRRRETKNRMLQKTRSKIKQTRNKTRKLQTKQTRSKTRKLQTSKTGSLEKSICRTRRELDVFQPSHPTGSRKRVCPPVGTTLFPRYLLQQPRRVLPCTSGITQPHAGTQARQRHRTADQEITQNHQ